MVIGAEYDTKDRAHLEVMANQRSNGQYHHCLNGSHFVYVDDQQTYFEPVRFLDAVDEHS